MKLTVTTTWEKRPRGKAHMRCIGCAEALGADDLVWFREDSEAWVCDLCLRDVLGVAESEATAR